MQIKIVIKRWWWLLLIAATAILILIAILQTQKRLKKINQKLENEIIHLKIKNHESNLHFSNFNGTADFYCL